MTDWDARFIESARLFASWSKDESTKVGAVVVGPDREIRAQGYNGFPRGIDDTVRERHTRPLKYSITEHAERNALYNACACGVSLRGCTIYCTHPPCCDCARGVIQSRIVRAVWPLPSADFLSRWGNDYHLSLEMFAEAKVQWSVIL